MAREYVGRQIRGHRASLDFLRHSPQDIQCHKAGGLAWRAWPVFLRRKVWRVCQ